MRYIVATIICYLALAQSGIAAETHLSNVSYARECFEAAARRVERPMPTSLRMGIDMCSDALEYQAMTVEERAATYSNRGLLYARLGELDNALKDHDSAVAKAPHHARRRGNLIGLIG